MASCLTGCVQEQANETAARVRFVLTRISGTRDAASLGMAFNLLFFLSLAPAATTSHLSETGTYLTVMI